MRGDDKNPGMHLIAKLKAFTSISSGSVDAINEMASRRIVKLHRGQDIISEGEDPKMVTCW